MIVIRTTAHDTSVALEREQALGARPPLAELSGRALATALSEETDLTGIDLSAADLRQVELSLSRVGGACFDDADLRGARLKAISECCLAYVRGRQRSLERPRGFARREGPLGSHR